MNLIPWRNKREDTAMAQRGENALPRLRGEIDDLFDRFFGEFDRAWPGGFFGRGESPMGVATRTDLAESDDQITVTAELPGVDAGDVDISIEGNMLMLRGEKKAEHEEKKKNYHYVERQFGSFQRAIPLPPSADPDSVDARYKNGVLTVTIGKKAEAKPKRIEVKGD